MKGYIELGSPDQPSYIREDTLVEVADVDCIVFDCDGVLIDVSEAYRLAVEETASLIIEAFTGLELPDDLIDGTVFHAFKRTGGFNNDWDLTYAIIAYVLSSLPKGRLDALDEAARESLAFDDPYKRFGFIASDVEKGGIGFPPKLRDSLLHYAGRLDETGVALIDGSLDQPLGVNLKWVLCRLNTVGANLIPTLFEQLFFGPVLYEETFSERPLFNETGRGFVEENRRIITSETLEQLVSYLGGPRFGIASGSMEAPARYVLGELIDELNPRAQIWMEDVERAEAKKGESNLRKPNPFSLVEASMALKPFRRSLYVGDTAADQIMVERAREEEPRYLFAGVYRHSVSDTAALRGFVNGGADLIAPSVNELPTLLEYTRSEQR